MRSIKFLGASGDVTGSAYLLTGSDGSHVMIDFGLFQGGKSLSDLNYQPLLFDPKQLKAIFLTHAHLDHCGRLPLLVFNGYFGKIYMTEPTAALVAVVLQDAAKVGEQDLKHPSLYGLDEVQKVLDMIVVVQYDKPVEIAGFAVTFKDAGHILGSASIQLTDLGDKKSIVFSGDLGNSPEDIVRPTEHFDQSDFVVMESTYGDTTHPNEDVSGIIGEEISLVTKNGGVLLIPAFSLERTQELLHRIYHLKKDGKVSEHTPVFLDSPMGIQATDIFKDFRTFYNQELQSHTDDPFSFPGLIVTESARDSRDIIKAMNPKVIIAGSGMMSGGRILHHAKQYLNRETTRILFVGYQAEDTLGRKILDGANSVWIDDMHVRVLAKVREIKSMSSHADQPKLIDWLSQIKQVSQVILTHGEEEKRHVLASVIIQKLQLHNVLLPEIGEEHLFKQT